jgi:predicted nucleotidyltransferase
MAGMIETSIGTTQRELNKLVEEEVVSSRKYANLRYYFLNKKNPYFQDLQKIVSKTIGIEFELKKIISGKKGVEYAFIFGSYARGGFNYQSDLDLFIIGDPDQDSLIKDINSAEEYLGREINYHVYYAEEFKQELKHNSFLQNAIKNTIFLTDNEDEFRRTFPKV